MRELPDEIAERATSLALLGAADLEREELLCDLLESLDRRLSQYQADGLPALLPELRAHDALAGQRVRADGVLGWARGIDDAGALVLDTDAGEMVKIMSGTVERESAAR
jgi:BirA family biotin operon repressor/biotin-[acetyl-CoA-carboxylase] ligase